jgi:ribosomal protein S18 acetylase RimI-like enzyme
MLQGFFVGWPDPPSSAAHLKLLRSSYQVVLAVDDETDHVVGFITAIGDGILSAHITLLEVLPAYQGQGIGRELMRRMLDSLGNLYAVDLLCDPEMQPFYARFGMRSASAMMIRNYDLQSGCG